MQTRLANGEASLFRSRKLGVNIKAKSDRYEINVGKLRPNDIVLYESGDTVTENVIMAAAKIPGKNGDKIRVRQLPSPRPLLFSGKTRSANSRRWNYNPHGSRQGRNRCADNILFERGPD